MLKVVEPSPAPYASPITAYNSGYCVRDNAIPLHLTQPVGKLALAAYMIIEPTGGPMSFGKIRCHAEDTEVAILLKYMPGLLTSDRIHHCEITVFVADFIVMTVADAGSGQPPSISASASVSPNVLKPTGYQADP